MNSRSSSSRRGRKDLPLTRLLPNLLTLLSLCSGLTAMRFTLMEKWHEAALAIVLAGIFDMLDGRVARMLNIASKFGAELDSLSDVISFGVAPGFIMYEWTMKEAGGLGWVAVLVYAVCAALRLARFNTMLEDPLPPWAKNYFTGIPAPAGAGMAILPLFVTLEFGQTAHVPPTAIAFWLILIGGLMVSRLPTLSLKGWRVAPVWITPIFLLAVLMVAALITNPWMTLSGVSFAYIISLPCGWFLYYQRQKREGLMDE
ncbi:MAG: CDP-diacylglycerol--serine O-phosphatidyltransferase [Alphaproteobacteria bacterium]|nr:CDP-diacylglycerol--serine O-phosphatidyltransferase [Alphaproteobacteria bacterium]